MPRKELIETLDKGFEAIWEKMHLLHLENRDFIEKVVDEKVSVATTKILACITQQFEALAKDYFARLGKRYSISRFVCGALGVIAGQVAPQFVRDLRVVVGARRGFRTVVGTNSPNASYFGDLQERVLCGGKKARC